MQRNPAEHGLRVNIRPGSRILSTLRHLNYRPWFALAEFVDNALQSFLANRERLISVSGVVQSQVTVSIDLETNAPARIAIRDDAAGIGLEDFARAFRPAEVPPDATGLSEYGMGMKSAACWFAPRWHVRTSAFGEPVERIVRFDINDIVEGNIEELDVQISACAVDSHFTEVVLDEPYSPIPARTLGKIKEHLTDIYRCYIRDGSLLLKVNGQVLSFDVPEILKAPFYREPGAVSLAWKKVINFDLGGGQRVHGFAALRQEGRAARAGFALFRRNRLIQGSGDEGWKHNEVFGSPNSYRFQRLFGELHLDGFDVSHTKDGFRWIDEGAFAQLLADELDAGDLPLLKQGEGYRQKAARPAMQRSATAAVNGATDDMRDNLEEAMPPAAEEASTEDPPVAAEPHQAIALPPIADAELSFKFWGGTWTIVIRIADDESQGDWLEVGDAEMIDGNGGRRIVVQLAGAHPFMTRFAHRDAEVMQALVRIAASLGLSEALLRSIGGQNPAAIRRTANELLRDVFSKI
jgi:hypothetical protein